MNAKEGQVKASIETITPRMAEKWLAMNSHNRNLKDSYIIRLAGEILRGDWLLNGESIKLNGNTLVDGQHRLAAVMRAGVPIRSLVVRGVPLSTQETIDTGSRRTLSDSLKLAGESNYTTLASALSMLFQWENGRFGQGATRSYPTVTEALRLLGKHPDLRESLVQGDRARHRFRISPSVATFVHYLFSRVDREDADDFFEKLVQGTGIDEGSPILALRRALERDTLRHQRRQTVERAAFFVKAWNAYRQGYPITLLKWSPGGAHPEKFPEVDD